MKTISVHEKAIVLVLTKKEAGTLKQRLDMSTGVKESKPLLKVKEKLLVELGEI